MLVADSERVDADARELQVYRIGLLTATIIHAAGTVLLLWPRFTTPSTWDHSHGPAWQFAAALIHSLIVS